MICRHCNTMNDDAATFCRKCGLLLQHSSSSKRIIYTFLLIIFILAGIGGIITGLICYDTYPELPGYIMISILGFLLLLLCIPINRKRTKSS